MSVLSFRTILTKLVSAYEAGDKEKVKFYIELTSEILKESEQTGLNLTPQKTAPQPQVRRVDSGARIIKGRDEHGETDETGVEWN